MAISQKLLKHLKENDPTLVKLDLSNHIESDEDIDLLVEALKTNICLKELKIQGQWKSTRRSQVSDLGAVLLSKCTLDSLDICNNRITDIGARALAKSTTLQRLSLLSCEISLVGVYRFLENQSLVELFLDDFSMNTDSSLSDDDFQEILKLAQIDIPSPVIESALLGDANARKQIIEWFNQNFNAGINIKYRGNIKEILFNTLAAIWHEKMATKLENNRAMRDGDFASLLGAQRQRQNMASVVLEAIEQGKLEGLDKSILALPEGVNTRLEHGCSLLTYAYDKNQPSVAVFLLCFGAYIEAHDRKKTLLFEAAEAGKPAFVRICLLYGANLTGEFDFNSETALSIAAFKMNENIAGVLEKHRALLGRFPKESQAIVKRYLEKWQAELTGLFGDTRWERFAKDESLLFTFSIEGMKLLQELKKILPQNHPDFERVNDYTEIYGLLHDKFAILKRRPLLSREQYFNLLAGQRIYQVMPLIRPPDQFLDLTEELCQDQIQRLNQMLSACKESDIDWDSYPRFFVAQYRCIHYYSNYFTDDQREDHNRTAHLGRMAASVAVYAMSSLSPVEYQLARESKIVQDAIDLRVLFQRFYETGPFQKNNKTYPSLGHYLQERMSNFYQKYRDDIRGRENAACEILADMGALGYPHFASSDLPDHALRYGFGSKPIEGLSQHRLLPNYTRVGKPQHAVLGKVFIGLYTPLAMHELRTRHVVGMHNAGEFDLRPQVAPERETGVTGGVEAGYVFYEECLEMPDLSEWNEEYLERFGIGKLKFDKLKQQLTQSSDLDAVGSEIIEYVKFFKEQQLLNLAQEEAKRRGGYLIYRHRERVYGLRPEHVRQENGSRRTSKHEVELLSGVSPRRFQVIKSPTKKFSGLTAVVLTLDQMHGEMNHLLHTVLRRYFSGGNPIPPPFPVSLQEHANAYLNKKYGDQVTTRSLVHNLSKITRIQNDPDLKRAIEYAKQYQEEVERQQQKKLMSFPPAPPEEQRKRHKPSSQSSPSLSLSLGE